MAINNGGIYYIKIKFSTNIVTQQMPSQLFTGSRDRLIKIWDINYENKEVI